MRTPAKKKKKKKKTALHQASSCVVLKLVRLAWSHGSGWALQLNFPGTFISIATSTTWIMDYPTFSRLLLALCQRITNTKNGDLCVTSPAISSFGMVHWVHQANIYSEEKQENYFDLGYLKIFIIANGRNTVHEPAPNAELVIFNKRQAFGLKERNSEAICVWQVQGISQSLNGNLLALLQAVIFLLSGDSEDKFVLNRNCKFQHLYFGKM